MIKLQTQSKKSSPKKVIPGIIILHWYCPKCEEGNDLDEGVISSFIHHSKPGQDMIMECEWCKEKVIIDYDKVKW